jgi:hypothetical protein
MKYFNIFKNTKKKEGSTEPDYNISVNVGTKEQPENMIAGACWLKDGKSGKYFSCKLSDSFVDHTKGVSKKGFTLELEPSNGNKMPDMPDVQVEPESEIPF